MADMVATRFRKLRVELPVDEPVDSKPWLIAGIVFAVLIVALIAFLFFIQTKGIEQKSKPTGITLSHT